MTSDDRALQRPVACPNATTIAYGIGHAGAGAAPWNPVGEATGESIELRALRLPGRESRVSSVACTTVEQAAAEIAHVVTADAQAHGKPVLVVGSCSGVLLSLAALEMIGEASPVRGLLCLRPPSEEQMARTDMTQVASMDSPSLNGWLRQHLLTPSVLLDNDVLFKFYEPVVRADFAMLQGYRYRGRVLSCPTFVMPAADAWLTAATRVAGEYPTAAGDPLTERPDEVARAIIDVAASLSTATE